MNSKGFTLMEILAVLLILAVVVMFAIPGIRAVRAELYHLQAKSAAVRMADAMRSFYKDSKGYLVFGTLSGRTVAGFVSVTQAQSDNCNSKVTVGVPVSGSQGAYANIDIKNLFACGYLAAKDFSSLPYVFVANEGLFKEGLLVRVLGGPGSGRYYDVGFCVDTQSNVYEC